MSRRKKYGFAVLIAIVAFLMVAVAALAYQVTDNRHRICTQLETLSSVPAIRPVDPLTHIAQQEVWENYVRIVALKKKFRCAS